MTLSRVGEPGYSSRGRGAERSGQPVSLSGTAGAGRAKPTRSTTAVRSTETRWMGRYCPGWVIKGDVHQVRQK